MDTTFEYMTFWTLTTETTMNGFHYNLPPSIEHTTSNKSNDINQKKLKITKEVKIMNDNDQRPELKLRANKNLDSVLKGKKKYRTSL